MGAVIKMFGIIAIVHIALGLTSVAVVNLRQETPDYGPGLVQDGLMMETDTEELAGGGLFGGIRNLFCVINGVVSGLFTLVALQGYEPVFGDIERLGGAWQWIKEVMGLVGLGLTLGLIWAIIKALPPGLLSGGTGLALAGLVGSLSVGWLTGNLLGCAPRPAPVEDMGAVLDYLAGYIPALQSVMGAGIC